MNVELIQLIPYYFSNHTEEVTAPHESYSSEVLVAQDLSLLLNTKTKEALNASAFSFSPDQPNVFI